MHNSLGAMEIVVILSIVMMLFGVGRIGKIGGELGAALREFRRGLRGELEDEDDDEV